MQDTVTMKELIKKPELYLGIVTLVVVGIFTVKAIYTPTMIDQVTKSISVKLSPTNIPTKAVMVKKETAPTGEVKKSMKQVTKFADTGRVLITAKEGDSFWKIAEKVCGDGLMGESLRQENEYREESLQPGDRISVSCN